MSTLTRIKRLGEATRRSSDQWLPAGYYDPEFASAVGADLDRLAGLAENWDGYGAPPIDRRIIAAARAFIASLPENLVFRPHIAPMSTGNLQLEWHHQGKILELEFETPKKIHFLQWHPKAGIEEEATFPASDIEKAVDLIQWFMSGTCV